VWRVILLCGGLYCCAEGYIVYVEGYILYVEGYIVYVEGYIVYVEGRIVYSRVMNTMKRSAKYDMMKAVNVGAPMVVMPVLCIWGGLLLNVYILGELY
jgi:hypothetical protein